MAINQLISQPIKNNCREQQKETGQNNIEGTDQGGRCFLWNKGGLCTGGDFGIKLGKAVLSKELIGKRGRGGGRKRERENALVSFLFT